MFYSMATMVSRTTLSAAFRENVVRDVWVSCRDESSRIWLKVSIGKHGPQSRIRMSDTKMTDRSEKKCACKAAGRIRTTKYQTPVRRGGPKSTSTPSHRTHAQEGTMFNTRIDEEPKFCYRYKLHPARSLLFCGHQTHRRCQNNVQAKPTPLLI